MATQSGGSGHEFEVRTVDDPGKDKCEASLDALSDAECIDAIETLRKIEHVGPDLNNIFDTIEINGKNVAPSFERSIARKVILFGAICFTSNEYIILDVVRNRGQGGFTLTETLKAEFCDAFGLPEHLVNGAIRSRRM